MGFTVIILSYDLKGELRQELGTDGSLRLDQRLGFMRADMEAIDYLSRLRGIKPYLAGYRLVQNGRVVRTSIDRTEAEANEREFCSDA